MAEQMRRQPQKNRKRSVLYGPLLFLGICAALVFSMSVFLRVTRIEVVGASHYTAEEVQLASGIDEGDNLFFINRFTVISRILSRLPYVDTAAVSRYLPGRVVITVTESQALACVSDGETDWVVDRNGKVLTQAGEAELASLAAVRGLTALSPEIGEVVVPADGDAARVAYLAAILDQLQARGLQGTVSLIDLTEPDDASLVYLGRLTVRLGANENVTYKFGKLLSAVSQLTSGDQGTLDVSSPGAEAVFSPG